MKEIETKRTRGESSAQDLNERATYYSFVGCCKMKASCLVQNVDDSSSGATRRYPVVHAADEDAKVYALAVSGTQSNLCH